MATAGTSRVKSALLAHVWLAPIMVLALWLRLAGLRNEHLYGDEAEYAIVARYLSRDLLFLAYPDISNLGAVPFVSQPPLLLYVMALFMKVMGPTDMAALLPSVLFGAATVAVVYFLGHRLGGRLMGIGAAALLAVLPFHVEMSRRAMLDAGLAFFFTLSAYFLVAWLQTGKRSHAVGVGVAVACAALSKLPGVLAAFVALAILVLAIAAVLVRRVRGKATNQQVRETLLQGGLGIAPVAIGGALYLWLLSTIQGLDELWIKLQWQLGRVDTDRAQVQEMTAIVRDWTFYFEDPKFSFHALYGGLVFALALVGLATALLVFAFTKASKREHLVVPVFVAIVLAFFLYSDRKEGFYLLPFAPFMAILVAYTAEGLRAMLAWAGLRFTPRVSKQVGIGAIALGALLVATPAYSAAGDSVDEFVKGNNQEKYFGYGTREAAQWIHEQDPNAAQHGTLLGRFSLHWYNEQETYHWYIDHTYLESRIQSGELKYIVYEDYLNLAFDREYMRDLIQRYNGQEVQTFRAGWGEVKVFELRP